MSERKMSKYEADASVEDMRKFVEFMRKPDCLECRGKGYIVEQVGTCHTSESECWKCRGTGKQK